MQTINEEFHSLMKNHRRLVQNYLSKLGLYMGQPRLLFYLEENPGMSQKELADMLEISKEATSVSIRRLEKSGFIDRNPCQEDRRINLLYLSQQGHDVVENLHRDFDKINGWMFVDLDDDETKELQRMLEIMNQSLEKRLVDEETV